MGAQVFEVLTSADLQASLDMTNSINQIVAFLVNAVFTRRFRDHVCQVSTRLVHRIFEGLESGG